MRPVERGAAPRAYASCGDAIGDLEDRLGSYCSYCERRLPVSMAVEHMSPKSVYPGLELSWDNFLLGCTNCNSVKGDQDVADADTLWPDRDNPMLAIDYSKGGFVRVAGGLDPAILVRTQKLIGIVGLDRHKARNWPRPARKDKRWKQRDEVWALAELCLQNFESLGCVDAARNLVLVAAKGYGFFSIWNKVFENHAQVKLDLIAEFPGTPGSCFDQNGCPSGRAGGAI